MTPLFFAIAAAAGVTLAGAAAGAVGPTLDVTPSGGLEIEARPEQQQTAKQVTAASAGVMVLHGTNDKSGIDPKIGDVPALSKPPFSSYNSYKLLDSSKLHLDIGKSMSLKLPTGRDLRVVFKGVSPPAKPSDPPRYVLTASIQKPDGKSFLPNVEVNAKSGEWFFVGGQDYKGGTLVIGIKVN